MTCVTVYIGVPSGFLMSTENDFQFSNKMSSRKILIKVPRCLYSDSLL